MSLKLVPQDARDGLRDKVLDRIEIRAVLQRYGVKFRAGGRGKHELESADCPQAHHSSKDAFRFNEVKKRWQCFKCNTHGDVFHYIATQHGLTCERDFPKVLDLAAELAGVEPETMSADDWTEANAQRQREREERHRAELEREARESVERRGKSETYWNSLPTRHGEGEAYLARRRIGIPTSMHLRFDRADAVGADSWSSDGALTLPVFDYESSAIAGVVRRRLPATIEADRRQRSAKAVTLTGTSGTGTLGNPLTAARRGQDLVVVEGIVDTITAAIAFPNATVFGSNGTASMPQVILRAAIAARRLGARLTVVPHNDERQQGQIAAAKGLRMATNIGLRANETLMTIRLSRSKDLNEAWISGWRPT